MATLTGQTIVSTYKDILKIAASSANAGVDSTLRVVEDGDATASALWLATDKVALGVDDTGADFRVYSATAGEGLFYDASQDELGLLLTTKLKFHDIGGGEEIFAASDGYMQINALTSIQFNTGTIDANTSTKFNIDTAIFDVNASAAVTIDGTAISVDGTDDSNITVTGSNKDLTLSVTGGSTQVLTIASAGTAANAIDINCTAGGVDIDCVGLLALNSSASAINIGNDADAQAINIGTGAAARVITIGNVTGATQVVLNSGTAGIALASTGAGDITIDSDDTLLLDADGVLELNSSAGVINIGNDAVAQQINIGTGSVDGREVVIGNTTGASGVHLKAGTGDVQITGSLGIGVAAPGALLQIDKVATIGSEPLGMIKLVVSNSASANIVAGEGPAIDFHVAEDTGFESYVSGQIAVVRESGDDALSNASMTFWTAGNDADSTEKMRIRSDGLVGIGTDAPVALFTVNKGTATTVDKDECPRIALYNDANTELVDGDFLGRLTFGAREATSGARASANYDAIGAYIAAVVDNTWTGNPEVSPARLQFHVEDVSGSSVVDTPAMTIKSTGNVGIGIITPPNNLSASPVQYSTGTASQSGTTVTGSGTTWTAAMVGSQFVYADGTSSGAITARNSNTEVIVTTSQTVSSQAYSIHYQGLQVNSTGDVGIGTTTVGVINGYDHKGGGVAGNLHLKGTVPQIFFEDTSDTNAQWAIKAQEHFYLYDMEQGSTGETLVFKVDNGGDTWTNDGSISDLSSDIRVKKDIETCSFGLDEVNKLLPKFYKFNGKSDTARDDDIKRVGFIADDIVANNSQAFQDWFVKYRTDTIDGVEVDDYKSLGGTRILYAMINAIKELSAKVTALENA